MSARIGTRRRNALIALALISLATVGACHKSATDPYDPEQSELRPAASISQGGVVQAGWSLTQSKKAASMVGSTIDAIGKALAASARN